MIIFEFEYMSCLLLMLVHVHLENKMAAGFFSSRFPLYILGWCLETGVLSLNTETGPGGRWYLVSPHRVLLSLTGLLEPRLNLSRSACLAGTSSLLQKTASATGVKPMSEPRRQKKRASDLSEKEQASLPKKCARYKNMYALPTPEKSRACKKIRADNIPKILFSKS